MPEGDTLFRAAERLHRALAGRTVTQFESVFPALTRVDLDQPVAGQSVNAVTARGKHLLMAFSGGLTLHTHLRMNGSWHLYRLGTLWRRPHHDMRLRLVAGRVEAVGFNVPVAEWLSADALSRHSTLSRLGPDLLADTFDATAAAARLAAQGTRAMDDVLLDQRVLCGIGNVFKSEILYLARVHPARQAGSLTGDELARLVRVARRLLAVNVAPRSHHLTAARGRRTTGRMHPDEQLWVYGRQGQPCFTCGAAVACRATGRDSRLTFWCPSCQPLVPEG